MSEKEPNTQNTRSKIANWAVAFLFLLGVVGLAIFLYWSYQPDDVLELKDNPVPVRSIRENPATDGVVILHFDYCKKNDAVGRVRTSFVSHTRDVFLPVSEDKQEAHCRDLELPVLIPKDLPPDEYVIRFRVEYQVNPITRTIEEFDSEKFKVESVNPNQGIQGVQGEQGERGVPGR